MTVPSHHQRWPSIPLPAPHGRGRSDNPNSRLRGHVHGDIPCGRLAPQCPRRHKRGPPVASSTAVSLRSSSSLHAATTTEMTSFASIPYGLLCGGGPCPPLLPPSFPWAASYTAASPPDHFLCGHVHLWRPKRRRMMRLSCGLVHSDDLRSSFLPRASSAATPPNAPYAATSTEATFSAAVPWPVRGGSILSASHPAAVPGGHVHERDDLRGRRVASCAATDPAIPPHAPAASCAATPLAVVMQPPRLSCTPTSTEATIAVAVAWARLQRRTPLPPHSRPCPQRHPPQHVHRDDVLRGRPMTSFAETAPAPPPPRAISSAISCPRTSR